MNVPEDELADYSCRHSGSVLSVPSGLSSRLSLAAKVLEEMCRRFQARNTALQGGTMKPNSIEFIYQAMNAIASGKHDPETERCLSDAIAEELLVMNASLVLARWRELALPTPDAQACIA
jgi:hypothetical protein